MNMRHGVAGDESEIKLAELEVRYDELEARHRALIKRLRELVEEFKQEADGSSNVSDADALRWCAKSLEEELDG